MKKLSNILIAFGILFFITLVWWGTTPYNHEFGFGIFAAGFLLTIFGIIVRMGDNNNGKQ